MFTFCDRQGEQNSVAPLQYSCQFPAMITAWREDIKALRPGLTADDYQIPFVFIQIAPVPELSKPLFGQPPGASQWTEIRFAQSTALLLNGTAMVPNNDLGDPSSFLCLHPRWKAEVGRRAALQLAVVAFNRQGVEKAPRVYGGPRLVTHTSPTFSVKLDADGQVLLSAQLQFQPASAGEHGVGLWPTKFCTTCCPNSTNLGALPFRAQISRVYPDGGDPTWARANTTHINGTTVNIEWTMPVGVKLSAANLSGAWLTYAWEDYPDCVLGDLDQRIPAAQLTVTPVESEPSEAGHRERATARLSRDVVWQRGNLTVVAVPDTFTGYAVRVRNHSWLTGGAVALQCGGKRYSTSANSLSLLTHSQQSSGTDPRLGSWEAITAEWSAGACARFSTAIFYFPARDTFEFRTVIQGDGANATNTLPASTRSHGSSYKPFAGSTCTEFPSFAPPTASAGLGFVTWNGDTLGSMEHLRRPVPQPAGVPTSSADFSQYIGGLVSGPLVLYGGADGGASSDHPPAVVLSPANEFDVARLMHTSSGSKEATRIVGGAQGMITSLPGNFTLRFLLSGREGVNAVMTGWGKTMQLMHDTRKFTLEEDTLSRQLHYGAETPFLRHFISQ
jgi:hypothetical protein